jgi:hypothetical protein
MNDVIIHDEVYDHFCRLLMRNVQHWSFIKTTLNNSIKICGDMFIMQKGSEGDEVCVFTTGI